MTAAEKDAVSHRGRAFRALAAALGRRTTGTTGSKRTAGTTAG